jgi:hypothetical protein
MRTTRARRLGAIAVALASLIAAGPTVADAGGAPMGGRGSQGGLGFIPPGNRGGFNPGASFSFNPSAPFSFNPPPRPPRRRVHRQRGFVGFGGGGGYAVPYVADQGDYYEPPAPVIAEPAEPAPNYTQVVVYAPPASPPAVATAPAVAPARPSVVDFPEGRYELRGDGISTPYTWVWIPNPPAAPPAPPPLGGGAASPAPQPSPARRSQLYRWLDDQGVVHLTDRLESVPEEYRQQLKRIGPS